MSLLEEEHAEEMAEFFINTGEFYRSMNPFRKTCSMRIFKGYFKEETALTTLTMQLYHWTRKGTEYAKVFETHQKASPHARKLAAKMILNHWMEEIKLEVSKMERDASERRVWENHTGKRITDPTGLR